MMLNEGVQDRARSPELMDRRHYEISDDANLRGWKKP